MSKKSRKKNKNKTQQIQQLIPRIHYCRTDCPYFPDMISDNYKTDEYGVKHRFPAKIFRCCFDNHPVNWTTPCPLSLFGSSIELKPFQMSEDFLTEYEREIKEEKQKQWEEILN